MCKMRNSSFLECNLCLLFSQHPSSYQSFPLVQADRFRTYHIVQKRQSNSAQQLHLASTTCWIYKAPLIAFSSIPFTGATKLARALSHETWDLLSYREHHLGSWLMRKQSWEAAQEVSSKNFVPFHSERHCSWIYFAFGHPLWWWLVLFSRAPLGRTHSPGAFNEACMLYPLNSFS